MAVPKRRQSSVRTRRRRAVNMRVKKPTLIKDKSTGGKTVIRPHYKKLEEIKK